MKKNNTTNQAKISKGYRLKPSTHKLIKRVQRSLNATQDMILSMAVNLLRKEKKNSEKVKINK